MNMRDFWAAEAAKMRDTSHLGIPNRRKSNDEDDYKNAKDIPQEGFIVDKVGNIWRTGNPNKLIRGSQDVYVFSQGIFTKIGSFLNGINVDDVFRNLLERNIETAHTISNPVTFYNYVKGGGIWDYKVRKDTIWGYNYTPTTTFKFNSLLMEPQDIGNFHYGVAGLAVGGLSKLLFSEEVLLREAGQAQIRSGTSNPKWQKYEPKSTMTPNGLVILNVLKPPYGNDPRDQEWIEKGFQYYKSKK